MTRSPGRRRIAGTAALAITVLIVLGPVSAMVLTALTTPAQFAREGLSVPGPWSFENFAALVGDPQLIFVPALTTIGVAAVVTFGQTFTAVLAAYAFARFAFPARRALFALYLGAYLAPPTVIALPIYAVFARVGLLGTFWALSLPFVLASPYAIFLLRQTFRAIPTELFEAAELDGASHLRTLRSVVLPISRSAVATVMLVAAVTTWNAYLWPRLAAGVRLPQIQVAIGSLQTQYDGRWTLVMAAACIAVLPPIAVAVLAHRAILRTVDPTAGAL